MLFCAPATRALPAPDYGAAHVADGLVFCTTGLAAPRGKTRRYKAFDGTAVIELCAVVLDALPDDAAAAPFCPRADEPVHVPLAHLLAWPRVCPEPFDVQPAIVKHLALDEAEFVRAALALAGVRLTRRTNCVLPAKDTRLLTALCDMAAPELDAAELRALIGPVDPDCLLVNVAGRVVLKQDCEHPTHALFYNTDGMDPEAETAMLTALPAGVKPVVVDAPLVRTRPRLPLARPLVIAHGRPKQAARVAFVAASDPCLAQHCLWLEPVATPRPYAIVLCARTVDDVPPPEPAEFQRLVYIVEQPGAPKLEGHGRANVFVWNPATGEGLQQIRDWFAQPVAPELASELLVSGLLQKTALDGAFVAMLLDALSLIASRRAPWQIEF